MPAKPKPPKGRFRTLVPDISHGDCHHGLGDVVDCLPKASVEWLLETGRIEATDAALGKGKEVKDGTRTAKH